jgi:hypothetical protein
MPKYITDDEIPGYDYGNVDVDSPISLDELDKLKKAVMYTEEDDRYLKMAGEVLEDQIEDILDVWYGFVGSHSHLIYYFSGPNGEPDENYLNLVRKRFGQWILDLCYRQYDKDWLDYQYEIGLRHHRTKKNETDNVDSVPNIDYRYLSAFIYPITSTIKPFLEKKGHNQEEVNKMYNAWFKAIVLTVTLWSYPYVKENDF